MKGPFEISSDLIDKHNNWSPEYYYDLVDKGELIVVDGRIVEPENDEEDKKC
jgi:hypothetical protein